MPRPLRSLRNRLTLIFALIVAGAIGIVYFYVTPRLEDELVAQKLERLAADAQRESPALRDVVGTETPAGRCSSGAHEHGREVLERGGDGAAGRARGRRADPPRRRLQPGRAPRWPTSRTWPSRRRATRQPRHGAPRRPTSAGRRSPRSR